MAFYGIQETSIYPYDSTCELTWADFDKFLPQFFFFNPPTHIQTNLITSRKQARQRNNQWSYMGSYEFWGYFWTTGGISFLLIIGIFAGGIFFLCLEKKSFSFNIRFKHRFLKTFVCIDTKIFFFLYQWKAVSIKNILCCIYEIAFKVLIIYKIVSIICGFRTLGVEGS